MWYVLSPRPVPAKPNLTLAGVDTNPRQRRQRMRQPPDSSLETPASANPGQGGGPVHPCQPAYISSQTTARENQRTPKIKILYPGEAGCGQPFSNHLEGEIGRECCRFGMGWGVMGWPGMGWGG